MRKTGLARGKEEKKINLTGLLTLPAPLQFQTQIPQLLKGSSPEMARKQMQKRRISYTKKKEQWSYIHQIIENNSNPWVVLDDLNFHLADNEAGSSSSSDGLVNNIVASSGLEDIGFIGKNFTWSNNNMGYRTIKSRIDMALGNGNWNLYFPNSRLHHVEENESLTRIPSNEELFATLKSMENWSSPRPEGFQVGFYKIQWATVGDDVCNMVKRFFQTRHILKQINQTYISLIPKKKKCTCVADYRPIGLCNTSYKIISKVLVNRMKPMMEKLISPYQAAYVSGRLISDNTVIAQEIIYSMKKKRGENGWLALKLDMSKAFDRLEWPFLLKVLGYFGFNDDFCELIQQCISTTQLPDMLNGSPCDTFTPTRGIRQGDPLSPYIFILAMEFLSRQLTTAKQDNKIKGIKVASLSAAINHLLFADDCLIFTQENVTSVNNLLELLHNFSSQSGQEAFKSIKDNFESRFNSWSSTSLSQAGRGTMIKHVINVVPIYQMGTFKMPANLLKQLTTIERKFFWGYHNNRGHNPISWMNVCRPTEMGGLAFRDLEKLNLALLTKLAWRIRNELNTLMAQTLSSKYFRSRDLLHQHISVDSFSYTWNGILKGLEIVRQNYFMEINNGKKTRIWRDRWIPGMSQPPISQNEFFRFYEFVEDLMVQKTAQWNTHLITTLFDADTALKIQALYIDKSKEDSMIWMPSKDGVFSVKSTSKMLTYNDRKVQIEGRTIDRKIWKSLWKCKVAQRIKLFAWKCIRGIHSTKFSRPIYNRSTETSCEVCGGNEETIEHIIFDCRHARAVWRGISINIDVVRANCSTVFEWVTKTIVKFNIDGSYDADTNQYGIGIVLRDSTGECIGTKRTYGGGALNPEVVECMVVRGALQWAKSLNYSIIQFEADAKLVADVLAKSARETKFSDEQFSNFDSSYRSEISEDESDIRS
ncbi:uncharacterized protein LOC113351764 [Papaver somniferum]|uniref:uncharacterized protein LOC113351764 n=1 Tax=Papaver somniferum TaxID=3469 RepID=UPI000E703996|nr:uncharacterized protein LOC113351764 [Papaver somniferum]